MGVVMNGRQGCGACGGMTLIDLMVVVVIVGILVTIGFSAYGGYVKRSREAEAVNALGSIMTAQQTYISDPAYGNGHYAPDLETLKWVLTETGQTVGVAPAFYTYGTDADHSWARTDEREFVVHPTIFLDHQGKMTYKPE